MATASAFGFSGYDPWGSYLESEFNAHYARKAFDYQTKHNYDYYLKSLRDSPSAQRAGLEAAGYNPMLALGSIGGASYSPSGSVSFSPSSASGGFDASSFADSIEKIKGLSGKDPKKVAKEKVNQVGLQTKQAEANVKKTEAEINKVNEEINTLRQQQNESQKRTWLDNPLIGPLAGALGMKGAEKLSGLFGGSAKDAAKAPIVKAWEAAARKEALKKGAQNALGIGSKMLRGISLPLLLGTAAVDGYRYGGKQYEKARSEGKKKQFRIAPWPYTFAPTY